MLNKKKAVIKTAISKWFEHYKKMQEEGKK